MKRSVNLFIQNINSVMDAFARDIKSAAVPNSKELLKSFPILI